MAPPRLNPLTRLALLFFSISLTANAISLSSFGPTASNLTAPCNTIYTGEISGCTYADFSAGTACSSACIAGMVVLDSQVYGACAGDPQNDQYLIGTFLSGQGISTLCPNVVVTTEQPNSVAQSTQSVATTAPSTQPAVMMTPQLVGTMTLSSAPLTLATTNAGLLLDTSSSPIVSSTSFVASVTPTTTITTHIVVSSVTTQVVSASTVAPSKSPATTTMFTSSSSISLLQATSNPTSSSTSTTVTFGSTTSTSRNAADNCNDSHNGSPFDNCKTGSSSSAAQRFRTSGFLLPAVTLVGLLWIWNE